MVTAYSLSFSASPITFAKAQKSVARLLYSERKALVNRIEES